MSTLIFLYHDLPEHAWLYETVTGAYVRDIMMRRPKPRRRWPDPLSAYYSASALHMRRRAL